MQPANSDVANQLREFGSLLRESNSEYRPDIYPPLMGLLNSIRAETLQQPGVRQSLAELKTILQKDPQASDILGKINNLSLQTNIAPPKQAKPGAAETTPKAPTQAAPVKPQAYGSTEDQYANVEKALRDIKFTFDYVLNKSDEYKERWKDDIEDMCQREGYEPLNQLLDRYEKASDDQAAQLLRNYNIQQGFRDAFDTIKNHPSTPKVLLQRLEQFNKRFDEAKTKPEFVRFTSSDVNIKNNLQGQFQAISSNTSFYTQEKNNVRSEMEFHIFCREPLQKIFKELDETSKESANALFSKSSVKEALRRALESLQQSPYFDREGDENLIESAKKYIGKEEPVNQGPQPLPSHVLRPLAAEAAVKETSAQPKEEILKPMVFSGEPSASDQRTIDHLANFVSTLQAANKEGGQPMDPNVILNISIAVSQLPDQPHPEIQNLVKGLAKALKIQTLKKELALAVNSGKEETESLNGQKLLLERLQRKIENFKAP